jgi:hypothetical protein
MAMNMESEILDLHGGFRAYGYVLVAEPVEGEEALFVSTYRNVLQGLSDSITVINRQYRTRGKSKTALGILHTRRPEPAWGVELAAEEANRDA